MKKVILSPKAKSDLSNIWDYSLDTWGAEQAETYLRTLWTKLNECAENPELAANAAMVRKDYRKMIVASHVIYFKEIEYGIDVIRILHQRMDFKEKV